MREPKREMKREVKRKVEMVKKVVKTLVKVAILRAKDPTKVLRTKDPKTQDQKVRDRTARELIPLDLKEMGLIRARMVLTALEAQVDPAFRIFICNTRCILGSVGTSVTA